MTTQPANNLTRHRFALTAHSAQLNLKNIKLLKSLIPVIGAGLFVFNERKAPSRKA